LEDVIVQRVFSIGAAPPAAVPPAEANALGW
jgi:hypothetical protein